MGQVSAVREGPAKPVFSVAAAWEEEEEGSDLGWPMDVFLEGHIEGYKTLGERATTLGFNL